MNAKKESREHMLARMKVGEVGGCAVVNYDPKGDGKGTICVVVETVEDGKKERHFFSKKRALAAVAKVAVLQRFVADPRFDPAAATPSKVVVLPEVEAPVVTNPAKVEHEMAALRAELAALRSAASGRLSPVVAA